MFIALESCGMRQLVSIYLIRVVYITIKKNLLIFLKHIYLLFIYLGKHIYIYIYINRHWCINALDTLKYEYMFTS